MKKLNSNITAILPAYNEEVAIGSMVLSTKQYANQIVVIDNGSDDKTAEIAEIAGAKVIRYHNKIDAVTAFMNGVKVANKADIIITMEPGRKQMPDKIYEFIDLIKNGEYDVLVGSWPDEKRFIENENVFHLNKTNVRTSKPELIVASAEFFNNIDMKNSSVSYLRYILSHAENNNLKIKHINLNEETDNNQFVGYDIGVVVPAYNEELLIEETINGIPKYVEKIYVIDDCSTDRTPEILKTISDPRVISVRHEKNKGVGAAIITGYKLALEDDMDIVAVMAGDDQMDPEQLPRLITPIIDGRADYTKGNRLLSKDFRSGMSTWRTLGNAMLTMITKIGSGYWHIMDPQNGYAAISGDALRMMNLDLLYPYYGYCNDMLVKLNAFGMRTLDVAMPARYGREKSSIRYSKYIVKVAPMIFKSFLWRLKIKYVVLDFHPLVLFYLASMVLLPFGVLFGAGILWFKFMRLPVSPNFPLLDALVLLMGFQFLLFAMLFDMQESKDMMR